MYPCANFVWNELQTWSAKTDLFFTKWNEGDKKKHDADCKEIKVKVNVRIAFQSSIFFQFVSDLGRRNML